MILSSFYCVNVWFRSIAAACELSRSSIAAACELSRMLSSSLGLQGCNRLVVSRMLSSSLGLEGCNILVVNHLEKIIVTCRVNPRIQNRVWVVPRGFVTALLKN
jgi:hypothetical protein